MYDWWDVTIQLRERKIYVARLRGKASLRQQHMFSLSCLLRKYEVLCTFNSCIPLKVGARTNWILLMISKARTCSQLDDPEFSCLEFFPSIKIMLICACVNSNAIMFALCYYP